MGAHARRPAAGGPGAADRGARRRRTRATRRDQGARPPRWHVAARRRPRHLCRAGIARRRVVPDVREHGGTESLRRARRRRAGGGRCCRGVAVVRQVAHRPGRRATVRGPRSSRPPARRRHLTATRGGDPAARRHHPHDRAGTGEPAPDHGRRQLLRRPAAVDPLPTPVRQRTGDGALPGRTVAGVRLRPPAAQRHLGQRRRAGSSIGGRPLHHVRGGARAGARRGVARSRATSGRARRGGPPARLDRPAARRRRR